MAIGLERLRLRTNSIVHDISAVLLTVVAGLIGVFGLLILENPILTTVELGGSFVNLAARLCAPSDSDAAALLCRRVPPRRALCQHHRSRRAGFLRSPM
jgi:hypothetical protein